MAENAQQKKALEQLKSDLFSNDEKVVAKALNKADDIGNFTLVRPLVELWFSTPQDSIKTKVAKMLNELKISQADQELMACALDERYVSVRKDILSFVWNSGGSPDSYIIDLCAIAMNGSFEEAFECLTIVENLTAPLDDVKLTEATLQVREFLSGNPEKSRKAIVLSLYEVLKGLAELEE
ncbi:MAG: hypothetical protein KDC12_07215 [Flavobacteriales bacterium]|nr:hypothetical protein [Flavobacteriales bacterium]